jgi:ABC-type dipeptide/oligopeptide/nickel transport system permease component
MPAFIARRLLLAILVIWGVVTIIFVIVRLVPGDPAALLLGSDATPEQIENARRELGLDQPIFIQYLKYLEGVIHFDFGRSYRMNQSATTLLFSRLPATALLGSSAMILVVVLSFPLGILSALKVGKIADKIISLFSLLGQSIPSFWVGIMCILIFARRLRWLPSGGTEGFKSLILPAIALSLHLLSIMVRLTRAGLLEVMNEPYIQTARAKGFSERIVVTRHALRNMMIPVLTVGGLQLASLLSGAVIIETVFAWPGVGRLLIDSINNRDYSVVQAAVAFMALTFVAVNLIVDILYAVVDPRIREGYASA